MKKNLRLSINSSLTLLIILLANACKKDHSAMVVVDVDRNVYKTITIGTQTWMAENLKTTHYRDGSLIPTITGQATWNGLSTGAMCWYNNDLANKDTYGALYNWYAVVNPLGLAPKGWHIATDADWQTLQNYLIANGYNYDGTTLGDKTGKALASTTSWAADPTLGNVGNDPATNNKSGLGILAGGYRNITNFGAIGLQACFWTPTELSLDYANDMVLSNADQRIIALLAKKTTGFSIRCVKD